MKNRNSIPKILKFSIFVIIRTILAIIENRLKLGRLFSSWSTRMQKNNSYKIVPEKYESYINRQSKQSQRIKQSLFT